MDTELVWLIAGVFAAVGEMLTMGFYLAPFSVGAFAALVAGLVGAGGAVQVAVFAGVTVACFALLRPIARRHLYQPPHIRTGTAALVGRTAIVLEGIDNDAGAGTVRLDGEVWTARALDEDDRIEAGTRVQVIEIRGATAVVTS
jgi:membrane protein implicated in regulation of membrane protease activity